MDRRTSLKPLSVVSDRERLPAPCDLRSSAWLDDQPHKYVSHKMKNGVCSHHSYKNGGDPAQPIYSSPVPIPSQHVSVPLPFSELMVGGENHRVTRFWAAHTSSNSRHSGPKSHPHALHIPAPVLSPLQPPCAATRWPTPAQNKRTVSNFFQV